METKVPPPFDTLVDAMCWLEKEGFTYDLTRSNPITEFLIAHVNDFSVMYIIRLEGQTDPDDEYIIYAFHSERYKIRGTIVNAFGVYADTHTHDITNKLLQNACLTDTQLQGTLP